MSGDKTKVSNKQVSGKTAAAKTKAVAKPASKKSVAAKAGFEKTKLEIIVSAQSKAGKASERKSGAAKAGDLWVAKKPLDNGHPSRRWSDSETSHGHSRLLELADIALGLKKPDTSFRKRRSGVLGSKP